MTLNGIKRELVKKLEEPIKLLTIMKRILTILTALIGSISMSAQTPLAGSTQVEPTEIRAGECYLFPTDFSNAYFTFSSETEGLLYLNLSKPLRIFGQEGPLPLFEKQCVQGIEAGKTYTFYNTITWGDSITMTPSFTEGKPYLPVALTSTSLADGSSYRTTFQDGDITLSFNVAINAASIKTCIELSNGEMIDVNNYRTSEDYNTQGTNYVVQLANTYESLLENGKLKKGENFKLVLSNIISSSHPQNVYEGKITLTLKASGEAVKLENANNQEKLKSYYMPGDEAGLIVLTFTDSVTCKAQSAILSYGDREAGSWTEIRVPYSIKGNTITWNVQDIHLNDVPADDEGNRYVSISLKEICDKDGNPVRSNAEGNTGTILFSYLIETMDVNIYADFMPTPGSNIDDTEEIEIWISAGKYLTFSGSKVSYQKDNTTAERIYTKEELRLEDDPYVNIDLLVYIPIKGLPFDSGEVTIELMDVLAANGTSPAIKASFYSEGQSQHIHPIETSKRTKAKNYYNINGAQIDTPQSKGFYLVRDTDGKIKKLFVQ